MHAECALSAAQYDVRCAVCRQVPEGVRERDAAPAPAPAHARPEARGPFVLVTETASGSPVVVLHTVWRRYLARRRRAIGRSARAQRAAVELRAHRTEISKLARKMNTYYERLCKGIWRHDPALAEMKKQLTSHRRKERRLERIIEEALDPSLVVFDEETLEREGEHIE